jgi:type I restriction enzyme S subunit
LDYPACFPDSLVGITPKIDNVNIYYLNYYIRFIKCYLEKLAPQAAQKNINLQQLSPTPIVLPPLNIQQEVVNIYNAAYKQKQAKEAEAKELLASIDDYLLAELGITLPEQDNSLQERIFITNFSKLTGSRFDPVIQLYVEHTESTIYSNDLLKNVAFIKKGNSITKDSVIEGSYPVIAGGQTSPYSHNQCNFAGNIITLSASGAYAGFVWYHDYPIFASDCNVIYSKDETKLLTIFLAEILKLKQHEIYHLQQGAGQPHVYGADLAKIPVPLPSLEKQRKITEHIRTIRQKAKQLQEDGACILADAKIRVEQMILG